MKIRTCFVSNSSSSSFCFIIDKNVFIDFIKRWKPSEKLIEEIHYYTSENYSSEEIKKLFKKYYDECSYLIDKNKKIFGKDAIIFANNSAFGDYPEDEEFLQICLDHLAEHELKDYIFVSHKDN